MVRGQLQSLGGRDGEGFFVYLWPYEVSYIYFSVWVWQLHIIPFVPTENG